MRAIDPSSRAATVSVLNVSDFLPSSRDGDATQRRQFPAQVSLVSKAAVARDLNRSSSHADQAVGSMESSDAGTGLWAETGHVSEAPTEVALAPADGRGEVPNPQRTFAPSDLLPGPSDIGRRLLGTVLPPLKEAEDRS